MVVNESRYGALHRGFLALGVIIRGDSMAHDATCCYFHRSFRVRAMARAWRVLADVNRVVGMGGKACIAGTCFKFCGHYVALACPVSRCMDR